MRNIKILSAALLLTVCFIFTGTFSAFADDAPVTGQAARDKAYQTMFDMATIAWQPTKTVYYYYDEEVSPKTWNAGETYIGMPYTHSFSNIERFKSGFSDWNATSRLLLNFQSWVPCQYISAENSGKDTIDIVMGNDCSGAVYWALSSVADVKFTNTVNMLPSNDSGLKFPTVQGAKEFDGAEKEMSSKAMKGFTLEDMILYYESLQKGDVLLATFDNDSGVRVHHTVMVAENDPLNRILTVIQQGGMGQAVSNQTQHKERLDINKLTTKESHILWNFTTVPYSSLFDNKYVPLTLSIYEENAEAADASVSVDNINKGRLYLASGTVTSTGSRLESVTISIYNMTEDKTKGDLLDSTTLYTATYRYNMFEASTSQRQLEYSMNLLRFAPYLASYDMKPGESYVYKLSAHLADGSNHDLKQFIFTY